MQARIVASARGAHWLLEGWTLFRAAPLGWLMLVFAYLVLTQFLALIPVLGSALAAVLIPGLTLGFMAVARAASRGGAVDGRLLFEAFRHDARRQVVLGFIYMACAFAVVSLGFVVDGDGALRGVVAGERKPDELTGWELFGPIAAAALAYAPVMMMFWFAPALCAWHSIGVAKALFFSFFACLLNWRAFVAYGAVAAGAMLAVNALLTAALTLAGGVSRQQLFSFVMLSLLLLMPPLFASFYASYRDVFGYHPAE